VREAALPRWQRSPPRRRREYLHFRVPRLDRFLRPNARASNSCGMSPRSRLVGQPKPENNDVRVNVTFIIEAVELDVGLSVAMSCREDARF